MRGADIQSLLCECAGCAYPEQSPWRKRGFPEVGDRVAAFFLYIALGAKHGAEIRPAGRNALGAECAKSKGKHERPAHRLHGSPIPVHALLLPRCAAEADQCGSSYILPKAGTAILAGLQSLSQRHDCAGALPEWRPGNNKNDRSVPER